MNTLQWLLGLATQTRLCAVFIGKDTLQPIKGLPIYAEAIVTLTAIPVKVQIGIKHEELINKILTAEEFSEEQQQLIKDVLIKYLPKHFGQPSHENLEKIIIETTTALAKSRDYPPKNFSEAEVESIIAFVIDSLIKEGMIKSPQSAEKTEPLKQYIPFGYLATDHAGYVSFDIENAIKRFLDIDKELRVDFEYWMYPNGDMGAGINVSALGRVTADYIYGNVTLTEPIKQHINGTTYHSLQNPGLTDWYLSPGSFSVNPKFIIGEDGCEQLYPANFATSEFRFFQIVRGTEITSNQQDLPLRHGFAYEYKTLWQPLGHTLGQIIYSLPLAPGEVIKIGIIDWKRNSEDTRTEDTAESEDLTHDTYRDRSIIETVKGALSEWQRGGNIMGGNSGGAGASFGMGMFGAAAGNAHSFGGGYSTSSGNRDIAIDTVQQVNDAFSQHSTAIRELRSTVVVQSDQQEYARAETRVIANNNHSHALTMLYYEVLRHFKVTTQFVRKRNVLLVDYSRWGVDFNNEYVINKYRKILEQYLLEPRYITYFDVVHIYLATITEANYQNNKTPDIVGQENIEFKKFKLEFFTGDDAFPESHSVFVDIITSKTIFACLENGKSDLHRNFVQGSRVPIHVYLASPIIWKDIQKFRISVQSPKDADEDWRLNAFDMIGIDASDQPHLLFSDKFNGKFGVSLEDDAEPEEEHVQSVERDIIRPTQSSPPKPQAYDLIQPHERMHIDLLKRHLIDNASYYCRIIWLNQDANDRAEWMEDVVFDDDNSKLIDRIENRPIDILGNYVVFPSNIEQEEDGNLKLLEAKTEKLMTLPTRGVFAEAKLSHCNASEIIDNTRFWDWQQSPIMEKAPDIDPISTESRNVTQNLAPTPFPSPIVNIVNPTAAPDPTAMAGALNLLGKSDIFRDMSMSKEVNDLLKKLSDNAVSMAEAATQARGIMQKQDSGGNNNSSSGNAGNPGDSNQNTPANTSPAPTKEENESKEVDNAQKKLEVAKQGLTPKQQQQVREKVTKDLTTENKHIHIELQTADRGGIIDVMEPADYDINQQYQGKLQFVGGTATVTTKNQNGSFHIKLKGKVPNIPGREYFSQIPGYENQSGEYYFESSCFFKFSNDENSILLHGELTVKTSEAVVNVDANGKLSLEGGAGFSLPIKVVKLDLTSKVQVDIGGQVGYKITYKIDSITGLSLKQVN